MLTKIYSNKILIGKADLSISDASMGVLSGEFIPNNDYLAIREIIWKFNSTNDKDFDLWKSLRLNVQLENGYFLHSIGGISIWDVQELKDEKIDIEIAGIFRHIIDDFFKTEPPRLFVEEPWEDLTIDQKIAFENELKKEIGLDKGLINRLIGSKKKHVMTEYDFSALCTSGMNDNVLFSIHSSKNFDFDFALVHLTWKQKEEAGNFPKTDFYKDFDDFKYNKMIPDKIEWEE
nr:hypothetical protein [uncultured Carboxylicivirga sp.]